MAKNSLWNLPSKKITANFRNKNLHYGLYLFRKKTLILTLRQIKRNTLIRRPFKRLKFP